MTIIIVTGSVGSGKTTLAKFIAKKLDYNYIDVTSFIKENNLSEEYDKEKDCMIVNEKKLAQELEKLKGDLVIDSHMSHYMDPDKVDKCFVTRCSIGVLKKRLEKRGYNKKKIKDNIQVEIFNVCFEEALEKGHKPILIETSKGLNKEIVNLI
jgi:adenylate kinase